MMKKKRLSRQMNMGNTILSATTLHDTTLFDTMVWVYRRATFDEKHTKRVDHGKRDARFLEGGGEQRWVVEARIYPYVPLRFACTPMLSLSHPTRQTHGGTIEMATTVPPSKTLQHLLSDTSSYGLRNK